MTTYNDIFVRDNFGDAGVIPSIGNPYQSPDIIPYQNNILTVAQAVSTYSGPDLGKTIVQQGLNNIYVRAKNLGSSASGGTVGLSYANSSLILLPTQWVPIQTAGGAGQVPFVNQSGNLTIAPSEICLGNSAFVLTGLPSNSIHYCLVCVVQTPTHPVTVPTSFPNNAAFVAWIQNNPAVGWRNITQVPNTQVQVVSTYVFGSTDPNPGYFHFRVMAPSGYNFPVNTGVQVQCTDSRCPFTWSGSLPAPDSQGNQTTGFDQYMPGNITTTLTATLTSPNGQPFPSGGRLAITYYEYPSAAPSELELSVGRHVTITRQDAVQGPVLVNAYMIQIGECWTYIS